MKSEAIICVDFDGTIVTHEFPRIGTPVPGAIETLKGLQASGNRLILYTMRYGETLQEAVDYCKEQGIEFYGVNQNPTQNRWSQSPKVYGHYYIDDAAVGCPLVYNEHERPYVDWIKLKYHLASLMSETSRENLETTDPATLLEGIKISLESLKRIGAIGDNNTQGLYECRDLARKTVYALEEILGL